MLMLPDAEAPVAPTHEFRPACQPGRRASRLSAPAPGPARRHQSPVRADLSPGRAGKDARNEDGRLELRAVYGPDYGRIFDHELVEAVQKMPETAPAIRAGRCRAYSTGNGMYDPNVDICKGTTTLYASDRDVFLFLVDDLNPMGPEGCERRSGSFFPRLLLLELGSRRPDAWHRELLSSGSVPEFGTSGRGRF